VFSERIIDSGLKQFKTISLNSWFERGLIHGFIGKDGIFRGDILPSDLAHLKQAVSSHSIAHLKQIHSSLVLEVSSLAVPTPIHEGDGWLIDCERDTGCWVIFTADCLPLMISFGKRMLLLHAGWRGLANGIIYKGLKRAVELQSGAMSSNYIEMLIGPAASKRQYEVGEEVLEEIGSSACYIIRDDKYFLSLVETAVKQFSEAAAELGLLATVHDASVCTIENMAWHSHRRDRESRGSNVMFFSLGGQFQNESNR